MLLSVLFMGCDFINNDSASQNTSDGKESPSLAEGHASQKNTQRRLSQITITEEANSIVDSTFSQFNLSDEDMLTLKQILSDPDPDPENKNGRGCGEAAYTCKWCGRQFFVQQEYITYQSIVEKFSNPLVSLYLVFAGALGENNNIRDEMHMLCNKFRSGNKYECSNEPESETDYCSEKCRYEAKLSKSY